MFICLTKYIKQFILMSKLEKIYSLFYKEFYLLENICNSLVTVNAYFIDKNNVKYRFNFINNFCNPQLNSYYNVLDHCQNKINYVRMDSIIGSHFLIMLNHAYPKISLGINGFSALPPPNFLILYFSKMSMIRLSIF